MERDLYLRDSTDSKYSYLGLESTLPLENVISKVKMILFSNKGDVLGDPEFGMNLEDYVFDKDFPEEVIKRKFNAMVAEYIPNTNYMIALDIKHATDGYINIAYLNISIDGNKVLSIKI